MSFDPEYVYLGDRLTDPLLVGQPVMAVRRDDGRCVRGANGNMLVVDNHGQRYNVLGRLLRKRKGATVTPIEGASLPTRAFYEFCISMSKLSQQMTLFNGELASARAALDELLQTPRFCRARIEAELGHPVADWVWNVWEKQRRTFGSGNGRIMRD